MRYVPPLIADRPTFEVKVNSVWDAADVDAAEVRPNLFNGFKIIHKNGRTIFYKRVPSDECAQSYFDPDAKRYRVIVEAMGNGT